MKLIVTAPELRYGGQTFMRDESFEASDRDARVLKAIKKAKDAPPVRATPVRQAATVQAPKPAPVTAPKPPAAPTPPPAAAAPLAAPKASPPASAATKAPTTAAEPVEDLEADPAKYRTRRLQAGD